MNAIFVPWLHMHQPPIWWNHQPLGNLEKMLNGDPNSEEGWNAQWFAQAYKNPAKYALDLSRRGLQPRMMVDYSGVLLEELAKLSEDGTFANRHVDGEPLGDVIALWREVLNEYPEAIEFAGTAYSHCYFPTTPERDWEAQIMGWKRVFGDLFGAAALERVKGFWLPEMGMMGEPQRAIALIRLLKRCGYNWLILPASALSRPEGWTTPQLENQVHELRIEAAGETETIFCVVRDTDMGIRQQSGHNADGCLNDIRYRLEVFERERLSGPPLIVPTSDGENGNVMMFEYFKNTFVPLVEMMPRLADVEMLTVSQYLDRHLDGQTPTPVSLNTTGGSWIGGHNSWNEGDRRQAIALRIDALSGRVAEQATSGDPSWDEARQLLLVCETSCFVYWNAEFWFDQADAFLGKLENLLATPV
jgi:hypothetical protein